MTTPRITAALAAAILGLSGTTALAVTATKIDTTITQADGYFVRVVTLTDDADTQITANTTTGIQQSFTTPGLVSAIELTDLSDQLLVAWSTATFDGGYQLLGYQLRLNGEIACELKIGELYCSELSERMFKLDQLALGESYTFEVAAVNQLGVGVFSLISHEMPAIPRASSGAGSDSAAAPETTVPPRTPIKTPTSSDATSSSAIPTDQESGASDELAPGDSNADQGSADSDPNQSAEAKSETAPGVNNWLLLIAIGMTLLIFGRVVILRLRR
jgi:hypothetical protein